MLTWSVFSGCTAPTTREAFEKALGITIVRQCSVSQHQLVILVDCVFGVLDMQRQGFILVQVECSYVQFAAAHVFCISLQQGDTNSRERDEISGDECLCVCS